MRKEFDEEGTGTSFPFSQFNKNLLADHFLGGAVDTVEVLTDILMLDLANLLDLRD